MNSYNIRRNKISQTVLTIMVAFKERAKNIMNVCFWKVFRRNSVLVVILCRKPENLCSRWVYTCAKMLLEVFLKVVNGNLIITNKRICQEKYVPPWKKNRADGTLAQLLCLITF